MYDNVIWIDREYWFWTLMGLSLLIGVPMSWRMGTADSVTTMCGAVSMSLLLIAGGLWFLRLFGIDIGMSGWKCG